MHVFLICIWIWSVFLSIWTHVGITYDVYVSRATWKPCLRSHAHTHVSSETYMTHACVMCVYVRDVYTGVGV